MDSAYLNSPDYKAGVARSRAISAARAAKAAAQAAAPQPDSAQTRASSEAARVLTSDSRRYTIRTTGVTERPFQGSPDVYHYAQIYGVKSVANGIPTANVVDVNVGRTEQFLPYVINAGDPTNYVVLDPGPGNVGKLADIFVQGTATDGIVIDWG